MSQLSAYRFHIFICFLFTAIPVQSQVTGLFINEILASNAKSDYDTITGEFPDWIELYNSSSSPADIGGFYLSTGKDNPTMWKIPNGAVITANGYIIFWADEADKTNHTNFVLNKEKGYIGLYTSEGAVADSFSYGFQLRDISYGRSVTDQDSLVYFTETSKGRINSPVSYTAISESPLFSLRGGFYSRNQTVTLSAARPGSVIHFTTNGSEPDYSSQVYAEPINISKTTALRARVIEPGALPGLVITQTYLIDEPISLPVISIVTDPANFFNDTIGIYITGTNGKRGSCDPTIRNLNQDWERPVNVELYERDGTLGFNQEAGVKIYGGCSRTRFPQKSLALYARKSYGKGSFEYRLFPDKSIEKFDSFVLRSSADDQVRTFMRDALAQYIGLGEMDLDIQAYRPAVVFFDGQYWGIHDIREKINEHYLENNYHLDKSTVNILQSNISVVYGFSSEYSSLMSFISSSSQESPSNYNFVKSKMDIDQFIDYEILHIYLAERDWPGNNIKYWNSGTLEHQRWRWICFDLDQTFIRTTANTLADATATNGPTWPNPPWSTLLLRSLLKNNEFRSRFIQRYAFYLSTTFRTDSLEKTVGEFKAALEPEIPRHITKWGGQLDEDSQETWMPPTFSSPDQWLKNIDNLISFVRQRPSYAINHLKSQFSLKELIQVKIKSFPDDAGSLFLYDRKVPSDFNGSLFTGIPVLLRAVSKPGYRFVRWELKGSTVRTDPTAEIYFTMNGSQEVIAFFEKSGTSEPIIIINEINYNSDVDFETGDWIELCNRQDAPVDLSGWKLNDSNDENEYVFPMGTVIAANGYMAVCQDIVSFTSHYNHLMHFTGNTGFGFKNGGEVIRLYNAVNVLADSVRYDNNIPWPEMPDGQGYTLALKHTDLDNDVAENWTAQLKGTPGAANDNLTGINDGTDYELIKSDILQNYPNPCNTLTNIRYNIVTAGVVTIKVYDINGREIKVPVNDFHEPGAYSLVLETRTLKTGFYFYTMEIGNTYTGLRKFAVIH